VLETAAPTFGLGIPTLSPWTLSQKRDYAVTMSRSADFKKRKKESAYDLGGVHEVEESKSDDLAFYSIQGAPGDVPPPQMPKRELVVSSKGNITATFQVPGLISVPTDDESHNVTIAELNLDATMSWVAVPKKEVKVHLTVCFRSNCKGFFNYSRLR
jgi:hypothetical protein